MLRRFPLVVGGLVALAALLVIGPVAVAVAFVRSSPEAQGPNLAAQIFIALLTLAVVALAGLAGWGLTRLLIGLLRGGRAASSDRTPTLKGG